MSITVDGTSKDCYAPVTRGSNARPWCASQPSDSFKTVAVPLVFGFLRRKTTCRDEIYNLGLNLSS